MLLKFPQYLHSNWGDGDITGEDIVRWLSPGYTSDEQIRTRRLRCRHFVEALFRIVVKFPLGVEVTLTVHALTRILSSSRSYDQAIILPAMALMLLSHFSQCKLHY